MSAKKILEDVASSYERLAELAEQGRKEKPAEPQRTQELKQLRLREKE